MSAQPLLSETVFKIDEVAEHALKKMKVRLRKELVTLRLENDVDPKVLTGKHLKPIDFFEAMQREDTPIDPKCKIHRLTLSRFKRLGV